MTTNPPPSPWQRPQPPGQPGPPPPPGYGPTGPPQHPPFPPPRPAGAWAPGTPPLAHHVTGYPQWTPQRRRLRPRPALWIGLSAAVVGVGGLVVVLLAVFSKTVLDNTAVAKGVRTILTTSYGFADTDVQEVTCPPDQSIEPGHRFICTAVISGKNTPITVTVRNEAGEYEVAHP